MSYTENRNFLELVKVLKEMNKNMEKINENLERISDNILGNSAIIEQSLELGSRSITRAISDSK